MQGRLAKFRVGETITVYPLASGKTDCPCGQLLNGKAFDAVIQGIVFDKSVGFVYLLDDCHLRKHHWYEICLRKKYTKSRFSFEDLVEMLKEEI